MIRLVDPGLHPTTLQGLGALQGEVDAAVTYAARVALAKESFSQHNRGDRDPFRAVRETLGAMCSGVERGMYCEDAPADEVEHHRPKDLYPEVVFAWDNFLFACGPCNGPKSNRFKVFHPPGATVSRDVTRPRGAPVTPPLAGDALLLDPRREDPLAYLWLDLATFVFVPVVGIAPRDIERAEYTRDVLRLNRDVLVRGRRNAFESFIERLRGYLIDRDKGMSAADLAAKVASLREMNHATVWVEMKRQRAKHPRLSALFNAAPEALGW